MAEEHTPRQAFTPAQWRTFMAIADTIFPAQTPEQIQEILASLPQGETHKDAVMKFLTRNASECTEFTDSLDEVFACRVPSDAVTKIKLVLDFLDGGLFTFLLTRNFTSFSKLPLSTRTKILQNWSQSWLGILRTLHRQLQLIYSNTMLKANPLLIDALEYPAFPPAYTPESNDPLHASCAAPAPPFHKPEFHVFEDSDEVLELQSDIVIVGSGAGGGVCAATLARELCPLGKSVTVLEKAGFLSPADLPLPEIPLAKMSHDNDGVMSTRDGHGLCVTGSTWGGGTTINWGLSLELEPPVVQEWSGKFGLSGVVDTSEFQDCQRHVRERMGVTAPEEKHFNLPNKLIWDGAQKLGLDPVPLPQNNGGRMDEHANCSHCSSGCRSGCKQGTAVSFLVDAENAGAKCITGVEITNIVWRDSNTSIKECAGVEGWVITPPSLDPAQVKKPKRKFRILSDRVILSSGALRTPTILQKSSINHGSVGKNLKVHPCLFVYGITDSTHPMDPWSGSPTTVLVPTTTDKTIPMRSKLMRMDPPPSMSLTCLPWYDPTSYLKTILAYKHSVTLLTLVRDSDSSGEIGRNGTKTANGDDGPPDIQYNFSKKDRETAIEGIILSCKVLLEGGCKTVVPCIPLPPDLASFTLPDTPSESPTSIPAFTAYTTALRRHGAGPGWVSGHHMGTARWGGSDKDGSVCDGKAGGKVWGTKGVYVVDASAFPSASGVNPMLTVMGLAEWAARRIVDEVKKECESEGDKQGVCVVGREENDA